MSRLFYGHISTLHLRDSDSCFCALSVAFATVLSTIICILISNAQENRTLDVELISFKRRTQEAWI
jgi:hypothetical protein